MDRKRLGSINQVRKVEGHKHPVRVDPWTIECTAEYAERRRIGHCACYEWVRSEWAASEYTRPTGYPLDMSNPRFVGEQVTKEVLQAFWESCTFVLVGKHIDANPRRTPIVQTTAAGEKLCTWIVNVWLDIDIARLGVLPRQHLRSMTIESPRFNDLSKLKIPERLFETPLQRIRVIDTHVTRLRSMKRLCSLRLHRYTS
jgi:hypothetical protein